MPVPVSGWGLVLVPERVQGAEQERRRELGLMPESAPSQVKERALFVQERERNQVELRELVLGLEQALEPEHLQQE